MALSTQGQEFTADEQAQFDAMREDDTAVVEPVAPAVEEPAADPAAAAEVEQAATEQRRQTMVPHAALHEERERRKASDARLALLEERTNLLLQQIGKPPQQQAAAVDPAAQAEIVVPDERADPVGHIIAKLQLQERELQTLRGGTQQQQQLQQQALAVNAIQQQARALENEFKQTTPDYDAAIEYLVAKDNAELLALGYTDRSLRDQIIRQKGLQIAHDSLQVRANPAERLYAIAKLRGFAPTEGVDAEETPAAVAATNGQARVAAIANGQRQSRTLSGTRGAAPQAMTAQRLIEMSPADFQRALENPANMALLGE